MTCNAAVPEPDAMRLGQSEAAVARTALGTEARSASWLRRRWTLVVWGVRLSSASAFVAVILLHPFLIATFVSSDGELEEGSRRLLYALQAFGALAGVGLAALARAAREHSPFKERIALGATFTVVSLLGCTIMMEGGLRLVHTFGRPIQTSRHYFFAHDPWLGWRHRPASLATFKNERVTINSVGLRDDELRLGEGSPTFRILFLGDSQLFGDGVSHEETFVERLQSALPGVEAINAGVIGYGTDQQLLYFERDGLRLRPNLTIVGLNAYDFQDNISTRVRSGYRKPVFELQDGTLTLTNVPVDPGSVLDRAQRWLNGSSHLYAVAARLVRAPGGRTADEDRAESERASPSTQSVFPPPAQMPRALEVTRLILRRLAVAARNAGGRLAVMFLPYEMDFGDDYAYREQAERVVGELQVWGSRDGYAVLDLRNDLRSGPPKRFFLDTMHFSPEGHRLVARTTRDWLVRSGLVQTHEVQ